MKKGVEEGCHWQTCGTRVSLTNECGRCHAVTSECGRRVSLTSECERRVSVTNECGRKVSLTSECGRRVSLTNECGRRVSVTRDNRVGKNSAKDKRMWKKNVSDKRMWKKSARGTNMFGRRVSVTSELGRKVSMTRERGRRMPVTYEYAKKRLCLISREEDGYDKWLWKTIASHYYVSMQEVCQWWAKYERIIIMVSHKPLIEVSGGRLSVTVWKVHAWSCSDKWRWKKIVSDTLKDDACMHFEGRCMHAHAVSSEGGRRTSVTIWKHGQCDKWSWKRIVKEGQGLSVTIKWAWIEISSYMYDRRLPVGMQVSMDKVFFKQLSRLSVMTPPPPPTPPLPELTYIVTMWSETDVCLPPPPLTLSVLELCKAKCLHPDPPPHPPPPTPNLGVNCE